MARGEKQGHGRYLEKKQEVFERCGVVSVAGVYKGVCEKQGAR